MNEYLGKAMDTKLIFLLTYLSTSFCFAQTDDCDLRKDNDGIKVYVCKSASEKFKTLRAEFILEDTSVDELLQFLFNVEDYPKWQYNMISAKQLERISDTEMNYQSAVDAPWPVDDRELVMNFKVNRDDAPDQTSIVMHNILSDIPVKSDFIRVPFFFATYQITEINKTSLNVIYTLNIDPGGSVPPWLVNIAMAEGPYVSFKNLKKRMVEVYKTRK